MRSTEFKRLGGSETHLLAAARAGDECAWSHLLETHRSDLYAHCHRMLGSPHDADDALQDALLRAWRGLPRFEGRSTFRTWLRRIATNTCLDLIEHRPKLVVPMESEPAGDRASPAEPRMDGASPEHSYERREAVELALVAALRHLPPRERAALILRDVFGFSAKEAARTLGTTVASVNSALYRARRALHGGSIKQSELARPRSFGDEDTRARVERFMAALEGSDVDGLLSLLTEDVGLRHRLRLREASSLAR